MRRFQAPPSRSPIRPLAWFARPSATPMARTSSTAIAPGVYELVAELSGFSKYNRRDIRLDLGRTTTLDVQLDGRRPDRDGHHHRRDPARRSHLEGDRRQRHHSRGDDAAVGERQLHRRGRAAAGRHLEHQHRVVRVRRHQRQRPGLAQQQLHARRRQQQRRRHRAAGGIAGAHAARGGRRVPGHHQPVRRGVRPDDGRDRQRHQQGGNERVSRRGGRAVAGREPDAEGLLREAERADEAGHPAADLSRQPGRPGRPGQGSLLLQRRARDDRSREQHHDSVAPGVQQLAGDAGPCLEHAGALRPPVERQSHVGRSAGCASRRRSSIRSCRPSTPRPSP